ncbi:MULTISPECIES: hypothetical protein [unclassified Massilia]|uniref:hypothetical protein n=1 Tax=unclassified Massilia TaxID=2609279 RepID=UPI00178185B8|nr:MULTISPECIES: hypothetical protein [unclassified Massilia]MBD8531683.1 hypothetical protein [Massilia sp. CFBP 13647]MBD8675127.1 hypothetical protein [Massilia sp. CFBP 13721]
MTKFFLEMNHTAEQQAVMTAVFAVTGKKVDEDDPIIVAALFQAYTMREATREVTGQIAEASQALKVAVDEARKLGIEACAITRRAASDEKVRAEALEARIKKALRGAGPVLSCEVGPPAGWRGVIAGLALGVLITGGVMSVACNFSFTWISDARLGAEFRAIVPSLEPTFRDKLIEHLERRRAVP